MTREAFGSTCTLEESGAVAIVAFAKAPSNTLDAELACDIAAVLAAVDQRSHLRATLLTAGGTHFCIGASFGEGEFDPDPIYQAALGIFSVRKPIVAAIQGAAIGGGLGLALAADFRVAAVDAKLSANFVRLGIHPGFGLTTMLPRIVGSQKAAMLCLTGRRVGGEEAAALGLVDFVVPAPNLHARAFSLAAELAEGAPLAVEATRATLRAGLVDQIRRQLAIEVSEQRALFNTRDFREGVLATQERRLGHWSRS